MQLYSVHSIVRDGEQLAMIAPLRIVLRALDADNKDAERRVIHECADTEGSPRECVFHPHPTRGFKILDTAQVVIRLHKEAGL